MTLKEFGLVIGVAAGINTALWLAQLVLDPGQALTWAQHLQAQALCLGILLASAGLALLARKITYGKNKKDSTNS